MLFFCWFVGLKNLLLWFGGGGGGRRLYVLGGRFVLRDKLTKFSGHGSNRLLSLLSFVVTTQNVGR
jgi:hypothetical protein